MFDEIRNLHSSNLSPGVCDDGGLLWHSKAFFLHLSSLCFCSVFITTAPERLWQPSCRSRLAAPTLYRAVWQRLANRSQDTANPLTHSHVPLKASFFSPLAVCFAKYSSSHSLHSFLYQSCFPFFSPPPPTSPDPLSLVRRQGDLTCMRCWPMHLSI